MPKTINIPLCTAAEIKQLKDDEVLISINNIEERKHNFLFNSDNDKCLFVFFDDVIEDSTIDQKRYQKINGETAFKMVQFIEFWKNKNFIIHCAAGKSRSAAVCLYINIFYGHELKPDFWKVSSPNPYVLGLLSLINKYYNRN